MQDHESSKPDTRAAIRSATARRRRAARRLKRMKLKRAMRAAGVLAANTGLSRLASETLHLIDERILQLAAIGDAEHIRRLQAVRQQLASTYPDLRD